MSGKSAGEVSGGAIVSVAETRGGDQDTGLAVIRLLVGVVPGLGGCVDLHFGASCCSKDYAEEERSSLEARFSGDSGRAGRIRGWG